MISKTFRLKGLHCSSCAMDIDGALEESKGVKEAYTNYARQTTEVIFDEAKTNQKIISGIIKELGYEVTSN